MPSTRTFVALATAGLLLSAPVRAADTYLPTCFKPFTADTKVMQFPAKKPPYRIAMANGFVGNTWRIQMIKTLKAYADTPEMKPMIKELKIVSTGTDVAAQIGAIDNFINAGFDAILTIAVNPTAFKPVIKRAKDAGVVLIPFDNVLDTDEVIQVNEDQKEMGRMMGRWLESQNALNGKVLEVRGLPGNSVDRDRHLGFREVLEAPGNKFNVTEVVGNWDTGTSQKVTADALAVHGHFDGVFTQGGSDGTVQAMMAAKHPFVPMSGEGENEFRKQIADHYKEGLKGMSYGQSPALVAIAMKAAISALQGNVMPQLISIPIPVATYKDLKAGENYWPDLKANFFAPNQFLPCGVTFTAPEVMAQSEKNTQ